ncbi:hypothetical protein D3C81_959990 [compost metagenome]
MRASFHLGQNRALLDTFPVLHVRRKRQIRIHDLEDKLSHRHSGNNPALLGMNDPFGLMTRRDRYRGRHVTGAHIFLQPAADGLHKSFIISIKHHR